MMRRIIIIVLVLISALAHGQIYQNNPAYGTNFKRVNITRVFQIPSDTTIDGATNPCAQIAKIDNVLYGYNCDSTKWVQIVGGTVGSHLALDSARRSNDTLFFRYTTGGELPIKIAQLPLTAVTGLPDSLAARPDTNFVKLIQNVDTVLTISAMQTYAGRAKLIVVKDTLRGGLFMSKGVGIVDNGVTFSGVTGFWTRVGVNNSAANILWYGAIPNDGVNDNAAVTAAIATRRAVYVPDGTFLITTSQTLFDNQSIYGNGISSILQTTTANNIQIINVGNYGTVRDLFFLGSGKGTTTKYVSVNSTQIGVRILSKSRCTISNCTFQYLGGAGFYCQTTANVAHEGSTVIACQADTCFNGFYSGTGGEYINYVACRAYRCDYGVTFLGGNNKFNSGTVDNCQTGIRIISDRGNDAHGEVVGSTINHSYDYSITMDSTLNSFLFAHNMIYYGKMSFKKTENGAVLDGNDIASTDTLFMNSAKNINFVNNRFLSVLPQLMKNWNGSANTNPVTSGLTMFNNQFIAGGITPYSQATHPQNQLLGNVNIYGNSLHWGNDTGILNTSFSVFQESDGTRAGYIGDAASFDNKMYIVTLNNRDLRFGGLSGDGSAVPVTMNAVYATDNHYAFGDSLIDRSGYIPMFRIAGGAMRSDSLLVAAITPTNRTHIVGSIRFQSGLPCINCVWTDTTGTGVGAWKPAASAPASGFATTTDANYTVQATDKFIELIQTSSLRTLTLPNPSGNTGRELWIRCAATGSGQWQTGTTGFIGCGQIGTPPFTPASTVAFSSNTTIHLVSDGTSWYCLN